MAILVQDQRQINDYELFEEFKRIKTFLTFDKPGLCAMRLARGGFVYDTEKDWIRCPECSVIYDKWNCLIDPVEEHLKVSPGCTLANQGRHVTTEEVLSIVESVVAKNRIGKETGITEDRVGNISQVLKSVLERYRKKSIENNLNMPSIGDVEPVIDRSNPDFDRLKSERVRLSTYGDWPSSCPVRPSQLAKEGFFYTGSGDRVCCVFCRGFLRNWDSTDEPKAEHRKHFPMCAFVRDMEVGNIRLNIEGVRKLPGKDLVHSIGGNKRPQVSEVGSNETLEVFMGSIAVQAVVEMGFSRDVIQRAMQERLMQGGTIFPDAESLVEHLLHGRSEVPSMVTSPSNFGSATSPTVFATETMSPKPCTENLNRKPWKNYEEARIKISSGSAGVCAHQVQSLDKSASGVSTGSSKEKKRKKKKCKQNTKSNLDLDREQTAVNHEPTVNRETTVNHDEEINYSQLADIDDDEVLMEENARLKEARRCKVCMDQEVNTVFLPCGHLICCSDCAPKVRNCPLCRTFIRGTVKTFLS